MDYGAMPSGSSHSSGSTTPPPTTAAIRDKIAEINSKIAKERKILEGFQAMRAATSNSDVIRTCEAKVRESQRTIGWFEESLRGLEGRMSSTASVASRDSGTTATSSTSATTASMYGARSESYSSLVGAGSRPGGGAKNLPPPPPGAAPPSFGGSWAAQGGYDSYGAQGSQMGHGRQGSSFREGFGGGASPMPAPKVNYTALDLIKADTPLTSAKISRMLHQIDFKIYVEKQIKEGIDKMAKLYLVDGDKKARSETENKRVESAQKLQLLQQALRKYKTLDVLGELGDEDDGIPEDVKSNIRKPVTGTLQITIKAARDLAHAPQPKRSKHASESVIYVKVEDIPRARTHPSRNDRWNEDFEIHVDKANEVEVTIYDKAGTGETPLPVGMLWLRLSDIVDELRKKKMGAEAGPGWVTAAKVHGGNHSANGGGSIGGAMDLPVVPGGQGMTQTRDGGIDAWFAVEPEGAVSLHLNFVKSNVRKRPYDAGGLGRAGAVRKRKEQIHEQNGHKFVLKQFYTVVLCAYCGEFFMKGAGMQCEDCKYACHAKCYVKVVTKCISKSNVDDKEDEKINHRIPHRFEPITNISPNWCCHCGMVLPLGRKNARKCHECGITCHADCAHLVPDFCGMSMIAANKLLEDIKNINQHKAGGKSAAVKPRPGRNAGVAGVEQPPQAGYQPDHRRDPSSQDYGMGGLSLEQQSPYASAHQSPAKQPSIALPDGSYPVSSAGAPARPLPPMQQPGAVPPRGSSAAQTQPQAIPPAAPSRRDSIGDIIGGYGDYGSPSPSPSPASPPADYQARLDPISQQYPPRDQYQQPPPPQSAYDRPSYQQPGPLRPAPSPYDRPPQALPADPRPPQQQQQQPPQQQRQESLQYAPPPQSQMYQTPSLPDPRLSYQQQQQQLQQQQAAQKEALYQQPGRLPPGPPVQAVQQKPVQVPVQQLPPGAPSYGQSGQPGRRPQQPTVVTQKARKVTLDDFNFLAVLGKGNFGKVMLAEEKRSNQLFAIKVLKKDFIIENDEVESTKSEKRVFLAAARERHPFLLGLHSCFQTETRIYFVMEYVSGGDLMLHIQREQFTPRRAKFYAAEVLLALEYFHKQGIVYRDLKLDNIMLTLDGHVKVGDYGLCKENMWYGSTTSTFCGTPEFMAPEIVLEQRYGRAVDWWAFGVLIYEMLLGQSPFRGEDEEEIFDAIAEDEPLYPIHMPKDNVSILQKLLTKDPAKRLGSGESDATEIKMHPFFKDTNFDDIFHKRIPSPFLPVITSATDTSNFDSEFTSEQPTLTPVHSTLSGQDQAEFANFSWIAPWANAS